MLFRSEEIQGDTGNSGNTGDTGDTGDTGNSGNSGNSGDSGNSGNSGDSGNTGDSGDSGNTGDTGNTGTDHTSPVIVSVSPAENEKGVALDKPLEITFSEALNCSTVTAEGVVSIDDASITVTCNDDDPVVTFTRVWDSDSRYKVTVKGAVIKDKAGNTMDQSKNWYFETVDLTTPFVVKEESRPVGQSVRTDKVVRIVFSEPVKPETVKISLNSAEVTETPVVTDDDTVFEWSPVLELKIGRASCRERV